MKTEKEIWDFASNCTKRNDFHKGKGCRFKKASKELGIYEEVLSTIPSPQKQKNYWTVDRSMKEALKHKTRTELAKSSSCAVETLKKHGLYEKACSHMKIQANKMKRLVYVFEFPKTKTAYIGITWNSDERFNAHINSERSSVYKYIQSTDSDFEYKKLTRRIR